MILHIVKLCKQNIFLKNSLLNVFKGDRFYQTSYSRFTTFQKCQTKSETEDNWLQIYKLPIIAYAAAFNRLKIYQAGLTAIGIPISYALESSAQIPNNGTLIFAALGVSGLITLTLGSFLVRNLIGIIYVNESVDKIKLSYIDFWGQRKNIQLRIDEVIPPYEHPRLKFEIYQTVASIEENSIKLKLMQRFGQTSDPKIFSSIFGE